MRVCQYLIVWMSTVILTALFSLAVTPTSAAENGAALKQAATANSASALAIYTEGKHSYDTGDYTAALHSFTQAAQLEPDSARWQYNIGLALYQLEHFQAAREAFLAVRQKDPEYKRAEIDKKLASMGFDASGAPARSAAAKGSHNDSSFDPFTLFIIITLAGLCIGAIVIFISRKACRTATSIIDSSPSPDPAAIEALSQHLTRLSPQLVPAEHALRLGEDRDLRASLDRATQLEHSAYSMLDAARMGDARALVAAARLIKEAEPLVEQIQARVKTIDPSAIAEMGRNSGESSRRSGCFFCARPLANDEYRRMIPLHSQQGNADVLACPACANLIAQGKTPSTIMLGGENGSRHWSEDPGFDPYLHRHVPYPSAMQVPAWQQKPTRPFSELALLAAGGALGAGAVYAATRAFDLDAAEKTGLAQEAARNAAKRAGSSRDNSDWSGSSRDSS